MNRIAAVLFLAAFTAAASAPTYAEVDALTLVTDMWARYRSVKSEREESEILVIRHPAVPQFSKAEVEAMIRDAPAGVTHKRAVRHIIYAPNWDDKLHILFSLPAEDAGLGFLVWRHADAALDEMWLFMPGYESVRRIPLSSRQKLAGMNFSYEDVRELAGERTAQFSYESAGTEELDGRRCQVITAKPKPGTSTAYSSRKVWLDQEWKFPLRVEYSGAGGKLYKVLHNAEIREVAPGVRRADLTEMRDVQHDEATLVLVTKRSLGMEIPAQVFTQDYLQNPGDD